MEKVVLSWSGGKDSALALHYLRTSGRYEVVRLLTTVSREFGRISHHGVRRELLSEQARRVGVPLREIPLPATCTNEVYEAVMEEVMRETLAEGIRAVAFGDIFLEDLRRYREANLARVGMSAVFPLWGSDTRLLVQSFSELGFRARLVCVDGAKLDRSFAGREIDPGLVRDLPPGVDPCGENGEYHSFVYDGPIFSGPVPLRAGEVVARDVRFFADLMPGRIPCDTLDS